MRNKTLGKLIVAPIGLYVVLMVVLAAFVVHPPLLGWIGLGLAASLAFLVTALAVAFFSRMRTNADRLHPRAESVHRILVVVDADIEAAELASAVRVRAIGRSVEIRVVAPVMVSPLHFASVAEDAERAAAERRLHLSVTALETAGVSASGVIGTDDPLQAVADVLADFPAHEILLVSSSRARRGWSDRDFELRARDLFGVPVATVWAPTGGATAKAAAD
jgi:hypothetical protein